MFTGIVHLSELRTLGIDPRTAIRDGTLKCLRPGWFAAPGAPPEHIRAVLGAGVVSCISFFAARGVRRPEDNRLHLGVTGSSSARSPSADLLLHWGGRTPPAHLPSAEATPERALEHVLLCQPPGQAVAVIDSALHLGVLGSGLLASTLALLPARLWPLLPAFDGRGVGPGVADAVPPARRRHPLRSQDEIAGVGRVDLLINDWLVIELDGRRWHVVEEAFVHDRRCDAAAARLGYAVLRCGYADVVHDWDRTLATICATLERGRTR
ncbi:endonuclease domain-containing protein [Rathayibacter iranicus]|uniref:DUF559 domain-containing protein n=2 Tax=Rathayibacter iranicus TaxID=59737 RepID=A0AAD1ACR4_9MICO|nr:DUF559 domain-containing protein [Rathayibacter iranicus]AZZ55832.1 DUF559 domain-containing protein [Rathayibacter iranicus]MWV30732.1 DUF559 domain-containing protein [Rathayibacter iranicus NCPPB 2253 = VKM Ac-1602]PPI47601.1 hypothetical protein C5E09_07105 [Rathayibacter iranicus]PPI60446.1 hypothetical protein C5E08_08035 [Rathayibacter iranicus]PPI71935.1 hypothetical protein C5E01_07075 [Rathayibacter iranicus]